MRPKRKSPNPTEKKKFRRSHNKKNPQIPPRKKYPPRSDRRRKKSPIPPEKGVLLLCPCLFCPSDNLWRSRGADAPRCAHFSTVISPSWITEQISVAKCAHQGASARREHQTSFKIVTWTKQACTKHHNTPHCRFDILGKLQIFVYICVLDLVGSILHMRHFDMIPAGDEMGLPMLN